MAALEFAPGIDPAQATKAFETILADLEKVRPLNYRSSLFTRWKQFVQQAMARFLGPDHPDTVAFSALVFHGPMPKSPMDPPVSDKDKAAFDASMAATAEILTGILIGIKGSMPGAPGAIADAPAPPAPGAAPAASAAPDAAPKLVFKAADTVARFVQTPPPPPPAAGDELRSTHDLARHSGPVPAGGIKIVSRSGTSTPTNTLEQFIDACEDAQQKALLISIRDAIDSPDALWQTVKNSLAELWWVSRDTVQKILPLILRR